MTEQLTTSANASHEQFIKKRNLADLKFYMRVAFLVASRSPDPDTQVGAVIVRDNAIVATGYNGHVQHPTKSGLDVDNDKAFPWTKGDEDKLKNKDLYVVHAEHNALLNVNDKDVNGCTMYVTLHPCNECAKLVAESGISKVVYYEGPKKPKESKYKPPRDDDPRYEAAKKIFNPESSPDSRPIIEIIKYTAALRELGEPVIDNDENQSEPVKSENPVSTANDENNVNQPEPVENTKNPVSAVKDENGENSETTANGKKPEKPKRPRPDWDHYFMGVAKLAADRSSDPDPKSKVGCCIVNERNRIVGVGYHTMPYPCEDKLDWTWEKGDLAEDQRNLDDTKHGYVLHAVNMAMLKKNTANVERCRVYVTLYPDNDCVKSIIQSKIGEVIYMDDSKRDNETKVGRKMLKWADIRTRKFYPDEPITFSNVDPTIMPKLFDEPSDP